nr:protein mesh-like [Pocillopora verrucosa]
MYWRRCKIFATLVLHITSCFSVPLSDFYPYGVSEGDNALPPNDDGSSGEIPISTLFPYFDKNHGSLYVNTNGVISFLGAVSQYTPAPFPLGDNRRLISPFWGDVDTRKGGTVLYRESIDSVLLDRATKDVRRAFLNHQRFSASWIFIVTWDRVAFYGAEGNFKNKVNNFQAVLVTNGRHSFAIFNYNQIVWTTGTASGGTQDGLGGTPAQGGFNAGDGVRFFIIPGSRTNNILNLPSTSNVARGGQWMFRTDEASVEAGGCNTKGTNCKHKYRSLTISPRSGIMLGGTNVKMSGPCFTANDNIVVQLDNDVNINATFSDELTSSVTIPVLNKTGRLSFKLSTDGGNSFNYNGAYTSVPINRYTPEVQREDGDTWQEDSTVDISWDSGSIGGLDEEVSIDLARYKMGDDDVPVLDSFRQVVNNQLNSGHSRFTVTKGEGDGNIDDRFINLVRVSRKNSYSNVSKSQWVWSGVFSWKNSPWAEKRCNKWHQKEPNPDTFRGDPSMQPCPLRLTQAMVDRGRFMSDEECNPQNRDGCDRYHKGAFQCFLMVNPSATGSGQQCCFNKFGNLMVGQPDAGSLDRVHPNAGLPVISHFFHDKVPYEDCCRNSKNCEKYFEKRPSDDGSRYQAPRPATGFGDPHMVTLDEKPFTFNGYGEYFILKVKGVDFTLQGRMEPLLADDGSPSKATVYTAFAAKENGSDVVQIQLNGRGLVDVLVNGERVDFDELSLLEFTGVSVLYYINTTKYSVIFNSGISVTVEGQQELLGLVTLVPTVFKGNTSGLLGYWDDSKETEFLKPDGTFLNTNSSLEIIHRDFGQLWVTKPDESLFVYQQGQDHSTFHHPNFQPIYPDSQNLDFTDKVLEKEAQNVCGDSSECLFDIFTTGKVRIGRATKEIVTQFVAVVNDTVKPACVPLDSQLTNGFVHRNDTDGGIDYKFACNEGFVLNGSSHVTCKDGLYNGSAPNCLPKECPVRLWHLKNGRFHGNGSVYLSTYHFLCNGGYVLVGDNTVTCKANGSWNGTKPVCLRECPGLPSSISNGEVNGSGRLQGSHHRFSCRPGYSLVGQATLHCTDEGKWNASVPICMRECPHLPSFIPNGFVGGNGSVEGSQYRFSCKGGYSLVGANTLQCTDQGNWNGSIPTCLKECPQLPSSIPNGFVNGTGFLEGSVYGFSCLQGYSLIGEKTLVCSAGGNWNSSLPSCLKDCPDLPSSIPNGKGNGTGSVEGSKHHFTCNEGYSLVGQRALHCNNTGAWNGSVPVCLIDCPRLPSEIKNGEINGTGFVEGSLYKFSCNDGYSIVGQDLLYCTQMGRWNAGVPLCLRECPVLPSLLANGFIHGSGSLEGAQYNFSCKQGYSLIGADTVVCTDAGEWNGSLPTCLIECPKLSSNLANGAVNGSGHVEGSMYNFSCMDGYSIVGHDTVFCTKMGVWNASVPNCLRECPVLPSSISHGFVNGSGSLEGNQYKFSCQEGYSLIGADTLVCTDSGVWNSSLPTCLIECPSLAAGMDNGYKHGRGSVEGSSVWFSCANGYSLEGNKYLYCDENGQWNGTTPSCLKDCPQMNRTLENGHIDGNGSTSGAVYSFLCDEGYSIDGETSLRCDEKGQWNGSIPVCLKAHTDKEEKDTNGWYLNVLNGVAILILIIAIGLLVIWCRRRSGKKDITTAKGDEEAELEVVKRPKVPVDSEDKCTTAPQNDRSKDPVGVV